MKKLEDPNNRLSKFKVAFVLVINYNSLKGWPLFASLQ